MIPIDEMFRKVYSGTFTAVDAKRLIKTSYYFGGGHAHLHIKLGDNRAPDHNFSDLQKYEERDRHSIFPTLEGAAAVSQS